MWQIISGIIISYLIGSIPTAYLFGKLKGIDIRQHGSGNVGATNALRVLGKTTGVAVLLLDALKGFIPVFLIAEFFFSPEIKISLETLRIIFGLSCISGHNWTIFLNFKGGKGVATTLGVLSGLAFKIEGLGLILGAVVLVWFLVFLVTRIVSISSIISAVSFPVLVFCFKQQPAIKALSIFLAFFIILRHKANLLRLKEGKEKRLL